MMAYLFELDLMAASVKLLSLIDHTKRFSFVTHNKIASGHYHEVGGKLIASYLQKSSRDCFFAVNDKEKKNVGIRAVRKEGQEKARGNKAVAFSRLKGDIFTYTYEIGVVNMGEQMTLSIKI